MAKHESYTRDAHQAVDRAGNKLDNAGEKMYDTAREIKGDVESLKNNIVGLAHKAIDTGAESMTEAKRRAAEEFDRLRDASANGLKMTEERIRDKPAQSIAIAFLAGFLVNALFGRK